MSVTTDLPPALAAEASSALDSMRRAWLARLDDAVADIEASRADFMACARADLGDLAGHSDLPKINDDWLAQASEVHVAVRLPGCWPIQCRYAREGGSWRRVSLPETGRTADGSGEAPWWRVVLFEWEPGLVEAQHAVGLGAALVLARKAVAP